MKFLSSPPRITHLALVLVFGVEVILDLLSAEVGWGESWKVESLY